MSYSITDLMYYFEQYPLAKESALLLLDKLLASDPTSPELRENLIQLANQFTNRPNSTVVPEMIHTASSNELAEFIAKRVFAFQRKGLWEDIKKKLTLCRDWPLDKIPYATILDFDVSCEKFQCDFSYIPEPKEVFFPEPVEISPETQSNIENLAIVTDVNNIENTRATEEPPLQKTYFPSVVPILNITENDQNDQLTQEKSHNQLEQNNSSIIQYTETNTNKNISEMEESEFVEWITSSQSTPEFEEILDSANPPKIILPLPSNLAGVPLVEVSREEEIEEYQRLQDERLRKQYQTLSDIHIPSSDVSDCKELILQHIKKASPQHLPRILKGILGRFQAKTQNKYNMMRCKDNLLRCEKVVTTPITLQVFFCYGWKFTEKTLKKLSLLSNVNDLNQLIFQFLQYRMEEELDSYIQQFRRNVELCQVEMSFQRILVEHPIKDDSLIVRYPKLQILSKLHQIYEDFQKDKENLQKILHKHFGASQANLRRCLMKLLEKNASFQKIAEEFQPVHDIHGLLKCLQNLKKDEELQKMSTVLFDMVVLFLRGHHGITFASLQTSLNFLPRWIQKKVILILQKKLNQNLQEKITEILDGKGPAEKRWKKLLQLLHHPQFLTSGLEVFSYPIVVFVEKLDRIARDPNPNKVFLQIFSADVLPESLKNLIFQANYCD